MSDSSTSGSKESQTSGGSSNGGQAAGDSTGQGGEQPESPTEQQPEPEYPTEDLPPPFFGNKYYGKRTSVNQRSHPDQTPLISYGSEHSLVGDLSSRFHDIDLSSAQEDSDSSRVLEEHRDDLPNYHRESTPALSSYHQRSPSKLPTAGEVLTFDLDGAGGESAAVDQTSTLYQTPSDCYDVSSISRGGLSSSEYGNTTSNLASSLSDTSNYPLSASTYGSSTIPTYDDSTTSGLASSSTYLFEDIAGSTTGSSSTFAYSDPSDFAFGSSSYPFDTSSNSGENYRF